MDSSKQPHHNPSNSDLFNSAKLVAGAATAALHQQSSTIDKAQLAGAAEDLLGAASHYGGLDNKEFGKYIDKAEDYLHKYHSSAHPNTTNTIAGSEAHLTVREGKDGGKSGGSGSEDYFKMDQGFLK